MKRKTLVSIFMVLLMTISLLLAGCAGNRQQAERQPEQGAAEPAVKDVILATTTSTQDSGLLDVLVPVFEEQTGYRVKTIAVGTGAALEMGEKGDADVLLVHAPAAEKPLVDSGVGINYELVMHNDFVLLGPNNDPAGVKGLDVAEALQKIAASGATFISRGDDSGTHNKELSLWQNAGVDPAGQQWYQETGQGMGATIAVANEKQGYTLSDRATYLAQTENIEMQIVSEGAEDLKNIYHVMSINPEKFPEQKINAEGGKAFVDFMISKETQEVINSFGVDQYGQSLFFADRLEK